jgi:acyl-CoA synthetase (AMP-forming)/AMP-acid ligase II/thioesterase domain-containing protein/acyl carrier protein
MYELILEQARCRPAAFAILAPGRAPLTFRELGGQVDATIHTLNSFGIGRNDHVATALPDGPEAAVAGIAIAAGASLAPLSPALTAREYDDALAPAAMKALVLPAGAVSPAWGVARARGIPILELAVPPGAPAGAFSLTGRPGDPPALGGVAGDDDVCHVFRSSGTTGRPKVFSLKQSNVIPRAIAKVEILQLGETDRCLNLFPLFHSQGIHTSVMAALAAGGSTVCVPGLGFPEFFTWLADFQPTWYTALPTLHQRIVEQAPLFPEIVAHHSLRFVHTASAAMSVPLRDALEACFQVRVIEHLASTEGGLVAKTPFPPAPRKLGSVGVAMPWAAVIDEQGLPVAPRVVGEIAVPEARVVRPDQVDAGEFTIVNGWYKTGDLGYLDDDRYLFLVGRSKEMINRGGEKVSPYEVEDQLARHPAVSQAAAFAIPDPRLGQDVAAAVALREGAVATGAEIREFVTRHLAHFKVPRVVLVVDRIPVGAVGKIQRRELAEFFQVELANQLVATTARQDARPTVPARDDLERTLVRLWETVLGVQPIGVTDDFFALGGDSLAAVRLIGLLDQEYGVKLSEAILSGVATIAGLADVVRDARLVPRRSSLVPLKPTGTRPPLLVCLYGDTNRIVSYRHLLHHLSADQPAYGVRLSQGALAWDTRRRVEDIATEYVQEIRALQPSGPYHLVGHSAAGLIAFEVASQLMSAGYDVAFLGLIDTACPTEREGGEDRLWRHLRTLAGLRPTEIVAYLAGHARTNALRLGRQLRTRARDTLGPLASPINASRTGSESLTTYALPPYMPRTYPGKVTLFLAADRPRHLQATSQLGWRRFAAGGFEVHEVPGDHLSVKSARNSEELARALAECLAKASSHCLPGACPMAE